MLNIGIELAENHLKKMFQQVHNLIDMNQVVALGPFLYIILEEV